jgi:hypothetical protein
MDNELERQPEALRKAGAPLGRAWADGLPRSDIDAP